MQKTGVVIWRPPTTRRKTADDPFTNPAVQQDEYIRKLRDKLSDLKEKREALLQIYTTEWPEVKKIDAQIKSTEADLKKAPAQVLASMKRNFEAAAGPGKKPDSRLRETARQNDLRRRKPRSTWRR